MHRVFRSKDSILGMVLLIALLLCAASCGSEKAESAPDETPDETTDEEKLSPSEEQAVTGEMQVQADEQINEQNAAAEADKLEKEIEADLK